MLAHTALAAALAVAALGTPVEHAPLAPRVAPGDISMFPSLACGRQDKLYVGVLIDARVYNGTAIGLHTTASYFGMYWTPPPAGGQGHIRFMDTDLCVDAGLNPTNGQYIKLWNCLDVPQQQWRIHDHKIELVGYNMCFDVIDGNLDFKAGYGLQLWQCYDGNMNQEWEITYLP